MSDARLAELFRRFAPVIHRRALALLNDDEEAKDATQDIFVTLVEKIDGFRGDSATFTWLYRVTTNHCLNAIRARQRRRRALARLAAEPASRKPDGGVATLERRDLIQFLLSHFDARKVQVVTHYYYDDLSQREIGVLLGISDRAVRKTLRRVERKMEALGASMDPLREEP